MMTKFRYDYERLSIPVGKVSLKVGLKPDFWTFVSLFSGLGAGVLIAFHQIWWGIFLILIMSLTDMLDGATARAGNMATPFGGVFDHTVDRYAEFFLLGGMMQGGYLSPILGIFAISGMIMASYARAAAESIGGMKNCVVGIAGRQEKMILLLIGLVLFGLGLNLPAQIAVFIIGLISHITVVQRLLFARKQILRKEE